MRNIDKDKEMCEAATPGPWNIHQDTIYHPGGYAVCVFPYFNYDDDSAFISEAREALPYWIGRYEAAADNYERLKSRNIELALKHQIAQAKLDELGSGKYVVMLLETYNKDVDDVRAMKARIRDLETQLQLHNRRDVASRTAHDIALEGIFGEMERMKDAR